MIKNYNNFIKESLLDKISGYTEDEIFNNIISSNLSMLDKVLKFCEVDSVKGIKYVLEEGFGFEIDYDIYSIYSKAISNDSLNVIKYLDEKGYNKYPVKDLYLAIVKNAYNTVEYLLSLGQLIKDEGDLKRLLGNILSEKDVKMLDLTKKLFINLINKDTSYLYRIIKLNLEIFKYFIDNGCDFHYANEFLLRTFVDDSDYEKVEFLLKLGANVNIFDNSLLLSSTYRRDLEMIKLLVKYGANIKDNRRNLLSIMNDKLRHGSISDDIRKELNNVIDYLKEI